PASGASRGSRPLPSGERERSPLDRRGKSVRMPRSGDGGRLQQVGLMRVRGQAAIRLLKALIVTAAVVPAVVLAYASLVNYRATAAAADERVLRSLDILREHAEKVFQAVELALLTTEHVTAGLSDSDI